MRIPTKFFLIGALSLACTVAYAASDAGKKKRVAPSPELKACYASCKSQKGADAYEQCMNTCKDADRARTTRSIKR